MSTPMLRRLSGPLASAALALSLLAHTATAQNQLWLEQFGTPAYEVPKALVPDGAGGVFALGSTEGALGGTHQGDSDVWFARLDAQGNTLWTKQYGTSSYESAEAGTDDGAGGLYVGGIAFTDFGGANQGATDAWFGRYDAAGLPIWLRQVGTSGAENTTGFAPDGAGGVFVTGETTGSMGAPNAGFVDPWIARYDAAGNELWTVQFGSSERDTLWRATADGAGGLFVGGYTEGDLVAPAAGQDAWLARHDAAGNQLWIQQFGTADDEELLGLATDGQGGVYVAGTTTGDLAGPNAGLEDVWLARYDAAGVQLWVRQFGSVPGAGFNAGTDAPTFVVPDGTGGALVGGQVLWGTLEGTAGGSWDVWLARYDAAGDRIWIQQSGSVASERCFTGVADTQGGAFLAGPTSGSWGAPNAGGEDVWIQRMGGQCGLSVPYCTASTTSIPGCQATVVTDGSPSLSAPTSYTLSSGNVPGGNLGLCIFGVNGATSLPFGTLGGMLCVNPPFFRVPPKPSGGSNGVCDGSYTYTLQELAAVSPVVAEGALMHVEFWGRDPANADGYLLSNAVRFVVCP